MLAVQKLSEPTRALNRIKLISFLGLLAFISFLWACTPEPGGISGAVLDELTGQPVANATITLGDKSIRSDTAGAFQIRDLTPGNYTLKATAADYQEYSSKVTVSAGQQVSVKVHLMPIKTSTVIKPQGGTAIGPHRATLEIPPQAIAQDVMVKILDVTKPPQPSEGATLASRVYEISAGVEVFNAPIKMTLPLLQGSTQKGESVFLTIAYWNGSTWVPIGGEIDEQGKTITVETSHLSQFAALQFNLPLIPVTTKHFRVIPIVSPSGYTVRQLADRLEAAWAMVIDNLKYDVPIPILQGKKINVWITRLGSAGEVDRHKLLEYVLDYVGYNIYIHPNIKDFLAEVVPAHEFFHIVQINSYLHPRRKEEIGPVLWWMEATAAWIGAKALGAREYLEHQRFYQLESQSFLAQPLDSPQGYHRYQAGAFVRYLEEKHGADVIKATWKRLSLKHPPLQAIDEALRQHGSNLSTAYFDFAAQYAYLRGSEWLRKTMNLRLNQLEPTAATIEVGAEQGAKAIQKDHLSGEALRLMPVEGTQGPLKLSFDWGSAPKAWRIKLFLEKSDGSTPSADVTAPAVTYEVPGFGTDVKGIVIMAVNASLNQDKASLSIGYSVGAVIQPQPRPPVPVIRASVTSGPAPLTVEFDASGSSDPDGKIIDYKWDFGDGTKASSAKASHEYTQPGTYTARLIVTDNDGIAAIATLQVSVELPKPHAKVSEVHMGYQEGRYSFEPAVLKINPGDTVRWICVVEYRCSSIEADHSSIPPGAKPWSSGDLRQGQAFEITFPISAPQGSYGYYTGSVRHGYALLGLIIVGRFTELSQEFLNKLPLEAKAEMEQMIKLARLIDQGVKPKPPVPAIKANVTNGEAPLTVQLDASESQDPDGTIVSYHWDFGNGITGKGPSVMNIYDRIGKFNVRLIVIDDTGLRGQSALEITVQPPSISPAEFDQSVKKFDFIMYTPQGREIFLNEHLKENYPGKYILLTRTDLGYAETILRLRKWLTEQSGLPIDLLVLKDGLRGWETYPVLTNKDIPIFCEPDFCLITPDRRVLPLRLSPDTIFKISYWVHGLQSGVNIEMNPQPLKNELGRVLELDRALGSPDTLLPSVQYSAEFLRATRREITLLKYALSEKFLKVPIVTDSGCGDPYDKSPIFEFYKELLLEECEKYQRSDEFTKRDMRKKLEERLKQLTTRVNKQIEYLRQNVNKLVYHSAFEMYLGEYDFDKQGFSIKSSPFSHYLDTGEGQVPVYYGTNVKVNLINAKDFDRALRFLPMDEDRARQVVQGRRKLEIYLSWNLEDVDYRGNFVNLTPYLFERLPFIGVINKALLIEPATGYDLVLEAGKLNKTLRVCPSGCEYKSVKEAINDAAPGNTIHVKAGIYDETGSMSESQGPYRGSSVILIKKNITIIGEGSDSTIIRIHDEVGGVEGVDIAGYAVVTIQGVTMNLLKSRDSSSMLWGFRARDSTQITLSDFVISGDAITGFEIRGSTTVELRQARISVTYERGSGLLLGGASRVKIVDSQISDNRGDGLYVIESAQAILNNVRVSNNGRNGLVIKDSAHVEVRNSTIEGNGTNPQCQEGGPHSWQICNGIVVYSNSQTTISDSTIKDNADWGVAAYLPECGYGPDPHEKAYFSGEVAFQGNNVTENNNKSGNHQGNVCIGENTESGPALLATPPAHTFGAVEVGSFSEQDFVVKNAGSGTLTGSVTTSEPFRIVSSSTFSLGGGQSQIVKVRFSPTATGVFFGTVNFTTNGGNANKSVVGAGISKPVPCNITVQPNESIPKAIENAAPGTVICLAAGSHNLSNLVIDKSLTLRGAGRDSSGNWLTRIFIALISQSAGIAIYGKNDIEVNLDGVAIQGFSPAGIQVSGAAKVIIQNVQILKGTWQDVPSWHTLIGMEVNGLAQVVLTNSEVSNLNIGIDVVGARAYLQDIVIQSIDGVKVQGGANLAFSNVHIVSQTGAGVRVGRGSNQVVLNSVTITGSGSYYGAGVSIEDGENADVELVKAIISQYYLGLVGERANITVFDSQILNNHYGVETRWGTRLEIIDSIIRDNALWGIVAELKRCGYTEDRFEGVVILQGKNLIEDNNKSGQLNGKGNPGNHPWNKPGILDGQVCLP